MGERKIKISYKFSIDKIQSLKDRNRQLEEDISSLIARRHKDMIFIEDNKKEIMENIDRINKLQKRFGINEERTKYRTQFRDKE